MEAADLKVESQLAELVAAETVELMELHLKQEQQTLVVAVVAEQETHLLLVVVMVVVE